MNEKFLLKNSVDEYRLNNRPKESERIRFNICGSKFEILESTLETFPDTFLANREWREQFWDDTRGEYFLDRNRACFKAVLMYFQSDGMLHRPEHVPEKFYLRELEFYGLRKPKQKVERIMPKNSLQKKIWELFEYADTSNYARIIGWISCCVVLLSIIVFCIETLPEFSKNAGEGSDKEEFFLIEVVCMSWFTFEYLVRFFSSPCKTKFVVGALNIIDLVAFLPFYVSFGLDDSNVSSLAILRALRLVRVFRIFKLSRYSKGLRVLALTMKASLAELGLLAFFLCVGVVLFSSAIYYAEVDENSEVFRSIPHAFWWAIVTMTTVGYGDMYPITFGGKIIGSLCAFTGILAIALPVPVIVANFEHFYNSAHDESDAELNNTPKTSKFDRIRKFFKNVRNRQEAKRHSVRAPQPV